MRISDSKRKALQVGGHATRKALRASGLDVRRPPRVLLERPEAHLTVTFEHLVALCVAERAGLFFVQIGAFDGQTGDPIHQYVKRYGWRGVLVEPQLRYFTQLRSTYAGVEGLDLRNVAVAERAERRTIYAVRGGVAGLPDWAPQTASFDRSQLERHGFTEDIIEEYEVDCLPFTDLLADVERVDLLQIDVEGFDAEIVHMFDFDTFCPRVVRFEHAHLTRAAHNRAVERLVGYGYQVALAGMDTICWHT